MKKHLFLWLFLALFSCLQAKDAYNIRVTLSGLSNSPVKLAYYYGDKQYVKQEATTDINGIAIFKGDTALPTGVYMVVTGEANNYFEFLVDEQFFSIETRYDAENTSKTFTDNLKATKSDQNTRFFEYLRLLQHKKEEAEALKSLKEVYTKNPAKKAEADDIDKKLAQLDAEVVAEQEAIITAFKGKLFSKLLLATKRPKVRDELTQNEKFYEYRAHFWDDFDFAFTGLLYSSAYHQRITEYMENLTVQHHDSVFASADYIIQLSKNNKEYFKYNLIWMLNRFAATNIICYDAVYVKLAQKYYATGIADWVEKDQLKKIIDNATALSKTLCGQKAPDIKAKSETYATPSLYAVNAKITVVLVWEADCGHCKKEVKTLKGLYATYKDKGFVIYSVETGNKEQWQQYSNTEGISWINLHTESISSDIKTDYYIRTTPQLFVLDANKNILYKRIDATQLAEILEQQLAE